MQYSAYFDINPAFESMHSEAFIIVALCVVTAKNTCMCVQFTPVLMHAMPCM